MKSLRIFLAFTLLYSSLAQQRAVAAHFRWDANHDVFQALVNVTGILTGNSPFCNGTASPFLVASGALRLEFADVSIPALGPDLEITRTYNGYDQRIGIFGNGWSSTYEIRLLETTDGIFNYGLCHFDDGSQLKFTRNADGSYTSPPTATGRLSKEADGSLVYDDNSGSRWLFNQDGRLSEVRDRNGLAVRIDRDGAGFPTKITDAGGRSLRLARGADGRVESITDPLDRTIRYAYDERGNLISVTDPLGNAVTYRYDDQSRLTAVIDARGNPQYNVTYDAGGRVRSYNEFGEPWTVSYPAGAAVKTDATRNSSRHEYDSNGYVTRTVDALGGVEEILYDRNGKLIGIRDPNGNRTLLGYDEQGFLATETDALDQVSRYEYDQATRQPSRVSDPRGSATQLDYDNKGNLVRISDDIGGFLSLTYDGAGQVTSIQDALEATVTFEYDPYGRLIRQTDPNGNATQFAYDLVGNLLSVTDALGRATQYEYDDGDRLIRHVDAAAGVTSFEYDEASNLIKVIDPVGSETAFEYDAFNRLSLIRDGLGRERTVTYDARGLVSQIRKPDGVRVNFTYDGIGRLVRKSASGLDIRYGYDAAGNLISAENGASALSFEYDALHRVVAARTAATASQAETVIRYAYDASNNLTSMIDPAGGETTYAYDAGGRLLSTKNPAGRTTEFSYDAASRPTQIDHANGTRTVFTYDAAGQLLEILNGEGGPNPQTIRYEYDAVGNRTRVVDGALDRKLSYDSLNRLTAVEFSEDPFQNQFFGYDAAGRRTRSRTANFHDYDAANQLLSEDSFQYGYDANGNRTSRSVRGGGQQTTYRYNADDQLTRVTLPNGRVIEHAYDALGRRIEQRGGAQGTRYVYDGEDILLEQDGRGGTFRRYTHGPGIDNPLFTEGPGLVRFFETDALGTILRVTNDSGESVEDRQYSPYGFPLQDFGTATRYGFTGREWENETDLYFYRARHYDPRAGVFLQQDPVVPVPNYQYALASPAVFSDPTGETPFVFGCGAGALLGAGIVALSNAATGRYVLCGIGAGALAGCAFGGLGGFRVAGRVVGSAVRHAALFFRTRGFVRLNAKGIERFLARNSERFRNKLQSKIAKGELPFELNRGGIDKAISAIQRTLQNPSKISKPFTTQRGRQKVIDIYSSETGFTVRVRQGGRLDTFIRGSTSSIAR